MSVAENKPAKRILILCKGNSARSQMAAAFLKSFDAHLDVYSAGTEPAARINPHAVQVMREVGEPIPEPHTSVDYVEVAA